MRGCWYLEYFLLNIYSFAFCVQNADIIRLLLLEACYITELSFGLTTLEKIRNPFYKSMYEILVNIVLTYIRKDWNSFLVSIYETVIL